MTIAKQMDFRSNLKKYFDMAFSGEPVIIPRKENRNVVILSEKEYKALENKEEVLDTRNWRDKSPLAMWGYSVNKRDDYTDDQRHAILEDIVDSGAMTKDRVLSYLDWFISLRQGHEDIASNKWIEDRKHIAEYKLGSSPRRRFL